MANKYRRSPAEPCARRRRRAARWETRAGDTAIPSPALSRVDSRRVSGPGPAERRDPRSSTMFMVAPSPTRGRAKVAPAPDPQSLSPAPGAGAGPTLRERGPLGRRLSRACARPSRPREVGFPPRRPPAGGPISGPSVNPPRGSGLVAWPQAFTYDFAGLGTFLPDPSMLSLSILLSPFLITSRPRVRFEASAGSRWLSAFSHGCPRNRARSDWT